MDTISAIIRGVMNSNRPLMVFDWDKAARLIIQHSPKEASAGLYNDWEWTGGTIYENGKPIYSSCTYLASTWAMPILDLDNVEYECYVMESETEWNHHTKWPQSALNILSKQEQ